MTTATKTKEHPILFTGEMVRAILDGRKTQTRRVIKPQPQEAYSTNFIKGTRRSYGWAWQKSPRHRRIKCSGDEMLLHCPYGEPGDRLWVRETFSRVSRSQTIYKADGDPVKSNRWKPSIYMFRHESRIDLLVKKIRVERVQDITPEDVLAEGLTFPVNSDRRPLLRITGHFPPCNYYKNGDDDATFIKAHYASLWDQINHKQGFGWDTNPWVWVVEFERAV